MSDELHKELVRVLVKALDELEEVKHRGRVHAWLITKPPEQLHRACLNDIRLAHIPEAYVNGVHESAIYNLDAKALSTLVKNFWTQFGKAETK